MNVSNLSSEFVGQHSDDPLKYAFSAKVSADAGLRTAPVMHNVQETWAEQVSAMPVSGKRVAYFHIPFCRTQCTYCGFFQNGTRESLVDRFVDDLILEIEQTAALFSTPRTFHAVYFGGGTPTDLSVRHIERITDAIHRHLSLANDCEFTFESRFNGLTDEKIAAVLAGGFNRISLGVQTFDTTLRRRMSRIDDQAYLLDRLHYLASLDSASIVIDLMYGLPWQSMADWQRDLALLQTLPVDGFDIYQLLLQPSTRMGKGVAAGRVPSPAATDMKAEMFREAVTTLEGNRYQRLSVSHWGSNPRERNFYNHYAKSGSYMVPFGSGGGGKVNGYGVMLHRSLDSYSAAVNAGEKPIMVMTTPHADYRLHGLIGAGFDLGYLNLAKIQQASGIDLAQQCKPLFAAWQHNGLAVLDGPFIALTLAGQFWQVNLQQALLNYIEQQKVATDA